MRKGFLVIALLITITLFSSYGCGISQEQYDATTAELVKAQQDLESVRAELEAAQAKISDLTTDISKAETELDSAQTNNLQLTSNLEDTQAKLEATQSELGLSITKNMELNGSLEKNQNEYESFKSEANRLFLLLDSALKLNHDILGTATGLILEKNETISQGCQRISNDLLQLRDLRIAEFNALWDEAYIETPQTWTLYKSPFVTFVALHSARIKDKVSWLGEHLN